jgi:hypothetical protein
MNPCDVATHPTSLQGSNYIRPVGVNEPYADSLAHVVGDCRVSNRSVSDHSLAPNPQSWGEWNEAKITATMRMFCPQPRTGCVRNRTDEPPRAAPYFPSHILIPSPNLSVLLSHNIDGMMVVASGNLVRVKGWSDVLRTAAIQFAVVDCQFEDPSAPFDRAEIWVENEDIEEARTALRKPNSDESLIC